MRAEANIGVATKDIYPEQFVRPFRPLGEELRQVVKLAAPRHGQAPRIASLKISEACNLNCPHCNANRITGRQMTTGEICKVLDNLKGAGIQMIDLTGGEPTLRRDLAQIISYSHKVGMLTTVNTNGGVRKETITEEYAYWYKLAESGLFGMYFSYDGTEQKSDPRVIRLASFAVNTLHISSGIRIVVTQDNLDQVYDLGERCMLNNIFFQAVPAVSLNGETSASPDGFHPLDDSGRQEFINIIHRLAKVRGPFANFLRVPNGYLKEVVNISDSNSAWHCKNPSLHWISVDARGNARVCNDIPLPKTYSLTREENPLLTKSFHKDVEEASKKCRGCSWFCHWEGNRHQLVRGFDQLRLFLTIGSLT